jgi:ABC-type sugar transport system ATPase subunit
MPAMPASDNLVLPILKRMTLMGFLMFSRIYEYAQRNIKKFSIVIPTVHTRPKNLSGGNQQKLMLATCLATEPDGMIINEPTRGIDVNAKAEIHRIILELAQSGTSVILVSSELPELMSLADRIMVMKNKTIAGYLTGDEINQENIMTLAAGETMTSEVVQND